MGNERFGRVSKGRNRRRSATRITHATTKAADVTFFPIWLDGRMLQEIAECGDGRGVAVLANLLKRVDDVTILVFKLSQSRQDLLSILLAAYQIKLSR